MIRHTLLSNYENREHLKNFWNVDCLLANITVKFRTHKQTTKPQTNYHCCLWLSFLAPNWLIPRNKITYSINISGVHGFVSFTVSERVFLYTNIYMQGPMQF